MYSPKNTQKTTSTPQSTSSDGTTSMKPTVSSLPDMTPDAGDQAKIEELAKLLLEATSRQTQK